MIRPCLLDVVRELQCRPQMYIVEPTFEAVCAYLDGYDHALVASGNASQGLEGFREWLVARHGAPELHWWLHVRSTVASNATDLQLRETLFSAIEEFWADREARGLQAIADEFLARVESLPGRI